MKTLIIVVGPTAVGKTNYCLKLAQHLNSPIISADSRQIYDTISIGTAAPTAEEMALVKHYFVHKLPLEAYYSAGMYEVEALELIQSLFTNNDTLVMTGGSMMYIDAMAKGIDEIPTVDPDVRQTLAIRLQKEGIDSLLEELRLFDPEYYEIVDHRNHKRVVHGLEIFYTTGKPCSWFRTGVRKVRPFRIIKIGLQRPRQQLFERINSRVDKMIDEGLLDEAKRVYPLRHLNSLNTVGYKELFKYLDGEWELPFAIERIKKNTRVYAKKQMLWFSKDPEIKWIDADTEFNPSIIF